jgi:hypothetical protein
MYAGYVITVEKTVMKTVEKPAPFHRIYFHSEIGG